MMSDEAHPQRARAQRTRYLSSALSRILSVFTVALIIWAFRRPFYSGWPPDTPAAEKLGSLAGLPLESPDIESLDSRCSLPTARYNIETGVTACYPSTGGIWLADLGPVELEYLGINRFGSTERSWDEAEEDRFCDVLRQFGGSWYEPRSPDDLWVGGECSELDEFEPNFSVDRRVAFPKKGGVWVLLKDEKTGRFPPGMAGLRNSLTMEERSMVLAKLGASYCEDVTMCHLEVDLSTKPYDPAEGNGV